MTKNGTTRKLINGTHVTVAPAPSGVAVTIHTGGTCHGHAVLSRDEALALVGDLTSVVGDLRELAGPEPEETPAPTTIAGARMTPPEGA